MRTLWIFFLALATVTGTFWAFAARATCAADQPGKVVAEAFNARWAAALRQRDGGALRSLYVDEALLMPPTDETLYGAQSIADYLLATPGISDRRDYRIEIVACEYRGDTLEVAGVWGATSANGDQLLGGNVVRVLKRGPGGDWAVSYDIWN